MSVGGSYYCSSCMANHAEPSQCPMLGTIAVRVEEVSTAEDINHALQERCHGL